MLSKSTVTAAVVIGGLALGGLGLSPLLRSSAVAQDGVKAGVDPTAFPPAVDQAKLRAGRAQSINNLKQIMLALHNYVSTTDRFPPPAIYGKDGQPLLSWRVAILPYLEEAKLYEEFRKDEPWDSPHNKALMRRMPAVFTTPHSPAAEHATRIQGFQGESAFFQGRDGTKMTDIVDGTSNTIALTLSEAATPWTKPGDLPFVDGAPLPALDESDPQGYLIALADGSVRSLAKDARGMPQLLRFMITRNGGEVIEIPTARPTLVLRPGPPGATPSATGRMGFVRGGPAPAGEAMPPSVEQRLQRLEEKLDRVLRKLDAMSGGPAAPGEPAPGGGAVKP